MRRFGWPQPSAALAVALALLTLLTQAACAEIGAPDATKRSATPSGHATASPTEPALVGWRSVQAPAHAVALRFTSSNPLVAYLCADDGPAVGSLPATPRLYTSVDGGMTWRLDAGAPVLQPVAASQVTTFAECAVFVDAHDARDVFLQETQFQPAGAGFAIARALWRSRDGGASWNALATLDRTNGFVDVAVFGDRLVARPVPSVYGASQCGPNPGTPQPTSLIDASDDGGQTWQPIGQSIVAAGYRPRDMVLAGALLFAIADQVPSGPCQPAGASTLWRSGDAGRTWTRTSLSAPSIEQVSFTARADGSGYDGVATAYLAANHPDDGARDAYMSFDDGATWTATREPLPVNDAPFVNTIMTPAGEVVMQANGGSFVYLLRPGAATWEVYASPVQFNQSNDPGEWQLQAAPQGTRLWSLEFYVGVTGPSQLTYLPLP